MILAVAPGAPETFAVTLARFEELAYSAMLDPHRERYDGVNYCRFYLAGFVAYIKLDRRPPPEWLASFILRPDAPITVLRRDAREGKDAVVMRNLANSAWQLTCCFACCRASLPTVARSDAGERECNAYQRRR
jgi:hypothetical protein